MFFFRNISKLVSIYIPAKKYIKYFHGTAQSFVWKCNAISEESIENITKLDSNFVPAFFHHHPLPDINFNRHCLIKNDISIPKKVINLYITYTLDPQLRNLNTHFMLSNCLFGSVKIAKNADLDKYKYTGYSIGFDFCSEFLCTDGRYMEKMLLLLELI